MADHHSLHDRSSSALQIVRAFPRHTASDLGSRIFLQTRLDTGLTDLPDGQLLVFGVVNAGRTIL
jgi:hypothetical protein